MELKMNNTNDLVMLYRYVQALNSDGLLYREGQKNIATPERKTLIQTTIQHIKTIVDSLEKEFN